jgi:hypothetical protein
MLEDRYSGPVNCVTPFFSTPYGAALGSGEHGTTLMDCVQYMVCQIATSLLPGVWRCACPAFWIWQCKHKWCTYKIELE